MDLLWCFIFVLDGNGYFLPSFDCDQVVAVSDMDVSMLFLFTQWNCIGKLEQTTCLYLDTGIYIE